MIATALPLTPSCSRIAAGAVGSRDASVRDLSNGGVGPSAFACSREPADRADAGLGDAVGPDNRPSRQAVRRCYRRAL